MAGRDELIETLAAWAGASVAVRIVTRRDELVAVFTGTLGASSDEKAPALFWPVEPGGERSSPALERPGIYLHDHLLGDVRVHPGEFVVEYDQADVTVNVRRR